MKLLIKLAAVLLALVVAAALTGFFYLDFLAKRAIEVAGTNVLGVETSVGGVSIGIASGRASLSRLAIANPSGFQEPHFFVLAKGELKLTPASLLGDVVRVPKIELDDIAIDFEEKLGGGSNVEVILANLKRYAGTGDAAETAPAEDGKKFVVDELTITNIRVRARTSASPLGGADVTITVPKVQLTSIGSGGSDPVGMKQLTGMVTEAVMQAVMEAGRGKLPEVFLQGIGNGLAGLGGTFTKGLGGLAVDVGGGLTDLPLGVGKGLGGLVEGVGKGTQEVIEGAEEAIGKGLEGLFKKKE